MALPCIYACMHTTIPPPHHTYHHIILHAHQWRISLSPTTSFSPSSQCTSMAYSSSGPAHLPNNQPTYPIRLWKGFGFSHREKKLELLFLKKGRGHVKFFYYTWKFYTCFPTQKNLLRQPTFSLSLLAEGSHRKRFPNRLILLLYYLISLFCDEWMHVAFSPV